MATKNNKDVKNVKDVMDEKDEAIDEPIKRFTRAEVARHTDSKDAWLIIYNKVYNVTSFLNEHPGGEEVLLEQAGSDGTEAFEDIGHSSDAREMMKPFKIGELVEEEKTKEEAKKAAHWSNDNDNVGGSDNNTSGSWRSWLIPIALGLLATLVYRYFISAH